MLSCLMDAWVSLAHFLCAREPLVLRLCTTSQCGLLVWARPHGLRLPPLHCCYLRPYDFYRRVYCAFSAVVRTVAKEALDHTPAYVSRFFLLHLNSVAGELVGLVPALRRTHVALRTWLARNHPSNWCVVPDSLRFEWKSRS